MKSTIRFLCAALLMYPLVTLAGEGGTNVRALGMAGAATAVSRGLDGVGSNPANLALPESSSIAFDILPFGVRAGSDFMTLNAYREYFTGVDAPDGRVGRFLEDADKQALLAGFPGDAGNISAGVEMRPFGLSVHTSSGSYALTVTEKVSGIARIPRAYVQFLFYGNTAGSIYDFGKTAFWASWTREYALSLAFCAPDLGPFRHTAVGGAIKLVHGYGYVELDRFNTTLATSAQGVLAGSIGMRMRSAGTDPLKSSFAAGYVPFPAPAGSGLGVDLGLSGELSDAVRVGVSLLDLGSITWSRNTEEASADTMVVIDDPSHAGLDGGVETLWNGKTREIASFTTALPATVRFGVAASLNRMAFFQFIPGQLTVTADYIQGLGRTASSTTAARFALGMEYLPWRFLPLRTGVSLGGVHSFAFGLGLGFHLGPFELDLASEDAGWLFAAGSTSGASMAMGMRLRM